MPIEKISKKKLFGHKKDPPGKTKYSNISNDSSKEMVAEKSQNMDITKLKTMHSGRKWRKF